MLTSLKKSFLYYSLGMLFLSFALIQDSGLERVKAKEIQSFYAKVVKVNKDIAHERLAFRQRNPKSKLYDQGFVKQKLKFMAKIDQMARKGILESEELKGILKNKPNFLKDNLKNFKLVWDPIITIDQANSQALSELIDIYGWFTISKFGEIASQDACLIIQHSPDINLQHKALFFLEYYLDLKEVSSQCYALLYDKLRTHYKDLGFKQRYGTQFISSPTGQYKIFPFDGSEEELDKRRKNLNLEPLEQYKNQINE
ncbi:MAG: hypothetical protein JWM09_1312 [Francisellaceae bacterium]|nr:hypothetical protein [Francisellaceae bacterium]